MNKEADLITADRIALRVLAAKQMLEVFPLETVVINEIKQWYRGRDDRQVGDWERMTHKVLSRVKFFRRSVDQAAS